MNRLSRLRELAALSNSTVKEFGLLTKNEPSYDQDGTFTGIENHYNGPGIAEAAGGAALVGAGLGAGHVGVMKKYGTRSVRRTADFLPPREVAVPVGQAYRKAGRDVLAKIRSLAGKRFSAQDRLKELARGDRAIPAMKAILKANKEPQLHLIGTEGAAVPALRGNVSQVRRAMSKFWGENASEKEAALHTKGIRGWAAGEIRSERALPRDLRAWAPKPSYKVKGNLLSSRLRLKELAGKVPRLTLAIQRQGILTRGEAESVPRSHRYGIDYGPEAVNHYGGNKKLITDAIKNRHRILPEIRRRAAMLSSQDRLKELAAGPVAHAVLGTATVGAYNAPWGKKTEAYKDGLIHDAKHVIAGGVLGGGAGAGIGALVGKKGARAVPALIGGLGGGLAGEYAGYIKAIRHPKAKEIRDRHLSAKDRLKELAEKSVALKSFDDKKDDNGHPILDTAVGAGLGAGAVLGHQAIMNSYGTGRPGVGGVAEAYRAAGQDFASGARSGFSAGNPATVNPPSTSEGSGMVATPATNSPLSHDGAKFSGTAPSVDAAPGVGGTAKVVEDSEEALKALKPGIAYRAGAAAGGLGSKIRGLLSGLRKVV